MTPTERKDCIERIRELQPKLEKAVSGLSDAQLDTPIAEGKWTPRQILHHIADASVNGYVRMKLVASEDRPLLKPYDQDAWALLPDTTQTPVKPSLEILHGLNNRWALFLDSVSDSGWSREGIHLENGKISLEQMLFTYAKHGESHLNQIVNFKAKQGW
jgi:hypothetical protein